METTHSKTGRAKKPASKIVVESWDDVWRSFMAENQKTTIESMEAQGWKLLIDVAKEIGLSKQGIFDQINSNKLESIKQKINYSGKTREMVFVRPKLTTSQ